MDDLTQLSATRLRADINEGILRPSQVVAAYLERIEAVNAKINAVISLRPRADILAEAQAMDRLDPKTQGPLFGLPIAIKDLLQTKGLRTTFGSPLFEGHIPEEDDLLVARIKAAGAVVIGKTNTPEWGHGSHSFNPVFGVTRNPYDLSRAAGGSSGGAAAALAAGLLPLADGSDMMGSLRNPAAFCNVYGFRPSYGLVPVDAGGDVFLDTLSTEGPMARSPEDLALFLSVLAGANLETPFALPVADYPAAVADAPARLEGRRFLWLGDWGGALAFEAGVLEQCETGLATLSALGARVDRAETPLFDAAQLWQSWTVLRSFLNHGAKGSWREDLARWEALKPETRYEIETGAARSAAEVYAASKIRSAWYAKAHRVLAEYDGLIMPSAQVWPFDAKARWPDAIGGRQMDSYHRWMEVVIAVSLIGVPAVALPAGFGAQGLPMGIQIAGAHGRDADLLALAETYHRATRWPERARPAL